MTMFMVLSSRLSHCESSPGSSDVRRPAPDGRRPSDQANRSGLRVRLYAAIRPTYIIAILKYHRNTSSAIFCTQYKQVIHGTHMK